MIFRGMIVLAVVLIRLWPVAVIGGETVAGWAAPGAALAPPPAALFLLEKVPAKPGRDLFYGPHHERALREAAAAAAPAEAVPAPPAPRSPSRSVTPPKPKPESAPEPEPALGSGPEAVAAPGAPVLTGIIVSGRIRTAHFILGGAGQTMTEGEALAGRYRIMRIEPEKVVLMDLSTGLVQVIDWGEEK